MFFFHAYSQSLVTDTTMATYLKKHRYILLSDSSHLPQPVMPFYASIMEFAHGDRAYLKNCYIPAGGALDEQYTLTITLIDITGISVIKKYDEDKAANVKTYGGPGEMPIVMSGKNPPFPSGNLSGRDGKLVISKLIGKIDFKLAK
ncbi:hypothetical protein HQ865_09745 [Mucilaginibacter mali]|uniref:Uncharacterized protein n=1 Tax=Mucilaginibacter mali TaxID=2740462 RepID=A0A7D4Q325_9SPHI|nr:hypothetical protein [Mucilaginibacter mali]QKJ30027.1 hypothetical protein HQ865_09745 [Mucilaginibacter mali]